MKWLIAANGAFMWVFAVICGVQWIQSEGFFNEFYLYFVATGCLLTLYILWFYVNELKMHGVKCR
jgi:hypothetical protein